MVIKRIEQFLASLYKCIRFSCKQIRERINLGNYYFPYSDILKGKSVIVLGNGPSLKNDVDKIKKRAEETGSLLYAVNNCAMTDMFQIMRPQLYCFIDHLYFEEQPNDYNRIYDCMNERVQWDMQLFIPVDKFKFVSSRINNTNITIIPVATLPFDGFEKCKYPAYKRGVAVPLFVNVVNLAIYTSLNRGVKKIFLYGVDHTFLRLLSVDDQNNLVLRDEHFYGSEVSYFPPKPDGTRWTVSSFVYDKYLTFKEHDNIRGYADYLGAEIINCTECSSIDSYVRLSQVEGKE